MVLKVTTISGNHFKEKVIAPLSFQMSFQMQWTSNMQKQEGQYPRQSSAERKEALYNDIIDFFDKGKVQKDTLCIAMLLWM